MLKDYFDSSLTWQHQDAVQAFLNGIPRHCVFSTYGQARSYRSVHCFKDANGRYDMRIFLYDGFYYVASSVALSHLKWLIAKFRRLEDFDLHSSAFDDVAIRELARDGVHPNK